MTHPNEDVVRGFLTSVLNRDAEGANSYLADDVVWNFGGRSPVSRTYEGKNELGQFVAGYESMTRERGAEETLNLHDVVANDEHVVVLWTRTAQAAEDEFQIHGVGVYHVSDGKISEVWVFHQDQYAFDDFYSQ